MDETQDAIEYQRVSDVTQTAGGLHRCCAYRCVYLFTESSIMSLQQIDEMLAGSLTQEDEDAVLAELEAITQVRLIMLTRSWALKLRFCQVVYVVLLCLVSVPLNCLCLSQGDIELPEVPADELPEVPEASEEKPGLFRSLCRCCVFLHIDVVGFIPCLPSCDQRHDSGNDSFILRTTNRQRKRECRKISIHIVIRLYNIQNLSLIYALLHKK